jgi:formate dehydrogenase iron-sulfur subunit
MDLKKAEQARAETREGLNEYRLNTILQLGAGHFARKSCMHCLEPSCVSACLVGGLSVTKEGAVVYDPQKCIGCRYCMLACPFHIPRYEWSHTIPFVRKCDFCVDRVRVGDLPACVEACPNKALQFGEREKILLTAHRRIKEYRDVYLPKIWGEKEFGGTSLLYISDVDLADLGWPEAETGPIPSITDPIIALTPHIGLTVFTGSFALRWIIGRRNRLMNSEGTTKEETH